MVVASNERDRKNQDKRLDLIDCGGGGNNNHYNGKSMI